MDEPSDLFDPRLAARQTDVDTSHDAAESMQFKVGKQHNAVLTELMVSYSPMAAEQIEQLCGYPVWRRMSELERAGLIERTDEKHKNRSGRMAYKYRLADG
jgi:predicted transcriptional regulator